jgi:hypothetical protein
MKILAILSRKNPHVYFLLWKRANDKKTTDDVREQLSETEQAKNNKMLRFIAHIAKPKPAIYFLFWKNLLNKKKLDDHERAKRDKMMKLLLLIGKTKPHIYFLWWKRYNTDQTLKEHKDEIDKGKKQKAVLHGGKNLIIPISRVQSPLLRLAFNKLLQPKDDRVRRMVMAFAHEHERALKRALCLWKIHNMKVNMEDGMAVLRKRPNIVDGVMMLDKVNQYRPRHSLRLLHKNAKHFDRLHDAVKKLLLINRVDLQLFFAKWSGRHDIPSTVRKTKDMLNALNLNLRPLKWSFDALKTYEPDMLRKAIRRMVIISGRKPRTFLLLWFANAKKMNVADDKKERMCKLLAIVGRRNPHVFFLLWKALAHKKAIDDVKTTAKRVIDSINDKLDKMT